MNEDLVDIGCVLAASGWITPAEINKRLRLGDGVAVKRALVGLSRRCLVTRRRWYGQLQFRAAGHLAEAEPVRSAVAPLIYRHAD